MIFKMSPHVLVDRTIIRHANKNLLQLPQVSTYNRILWADKENDKVTARERDANQ